jgi:DNA-binding CsgD family transcriptional regulator
VIERHGRRLTVRLLADSGSGCTMAISERATISVETLRPLGLTRRQSEILVWIAHGKTNMEIAMILGLQIGTVHKHTEHIFARLGVETRTAAAAVAWETFHAPIGPG